MEPTEDPTMEGYALASACCKVTGCYDPGTDGDYCDHHASWHCPVCMFAEATRQYDRHGIYCGRMCDACYKVSSYATYEAEEPIDAEPDCAGTEREWSERE